MLRVVKTAVMVPVAIIYLLLLMVAFFGSFVLIIFWIPIQLAFALAGETKIANWMEKYYPPFVVLDLMGKE